MCACCFAAVVLLAARYTTALLAVAPLQPAAALLVFLSLSKGPHCALLCFASHCDAASARRQPRHTRVFCRTALTALHFMCRADTHSPPLLLLHPFGDSHSHSAHTSSPSHTTRCSSAQSHTNIPLEAAAIHTCAQLLIALARRSPTRTIASTLCTMRVLS